MSGVMTDSASRRKPPGTGIGSARTIAGTSSAEEDLSAYVGQWLRFDVQTANINIAFGATGLSAADANDAVFWANRSEEVYITSDRAFFRAIRIGGTSATLTISQVGE